MHSTCSAAANLDVQKKNPLTVAIKATWVVIITIVLVAGSFRTFGQHYQFFYDSQDVRCIPEYRFYFIKRTADAKPNIKRGSIYAFHARNMGPYFKDGTMMGKYALAVGGDHVVINEHGVFVNGDLKVSGFVLAKKLGVEEKDLYKDYVLKPDQIFFAGTGERSFDSRYWGLASSDQVFGEALPLW